MIATYNKRKEYFEGCKKAQLHPETKKPLSSKDYEMHPWLFPDDAATFKLTEMNDADNADDEDYDMSGVHIYGA